MICVLVIQIGGICCKICCSQELMAEIVLEKEVIVFVVTDRNTTAAGFCTFASPVLWCTTGR